MGCICSGREADYFEDNYFNFFENTLKLHTKSSTYIDRIFYRYSYQNFLNTNQMELACSYLNISFKTHENFFSYFLEGKKYSAKKLSLLGVFFGKGSQKSKNSLIFDNYDRELKDSLEYSQIRDMIHDLLSISCLHIPSYILSKNSKDKDLENLCFKLRTSLGQMTTYYCETIIEKEAKLSKEKFLELLFRKNLQLSSARQIRKDLVNLYNREIEPIEFQIRRLDNSQIVHDKTIKRYFTMIDSARMSKKNTLESFLIKFSKDI